MPLSKGRFRRQAPYADVPETRGLRGGGEKTKKRTVTDANQKRLKQNPQLTSILRLITLIKAE